MRIIVNIGMPKTGTTTLQNSLANSYNFLINHGVLYPLVKGMNNNHFFLGAIVTGKPGDLRIYKAIFDQNIGRFEQAKKQFWNSIDYQIRTYQPHTLILSGESLADPPRCYHASYLRDLLLPWSSDIKIVLYVRNPAHYYLSRVQQRIKASSTFQDPDKFNAYYKTILQNYQYAFFEEVYVIPFDFPKFNFNCLVRDFLSRFAPNIPSESPQIIVKKGNKSPPPEVTYCVQNFRKVNFPQIDDQFNIQTNNLHSILTQLASNILGNKKAELFRQIYKKIIYNHLEDLNWLKNNYNVTFDDIDYENLRQKNEPEQLWDVESFADIVPIDHEIAHKLEQQALNVLISNYLTLQRKLEG